MLPKIFNLWQHNKSKWNKISKDILWSFVQPMSWNIDLLLSCAIVSIFRVTIQKCQSIIFSRLFPVVSCLKVALKDFRKLMWIQLYWSLFFVKLHAFRQLLLHTANRMLGRSLLWESKSINATTPRSLSSKLFRIVYESHWQYRCAKCVRIRSYSGPHFPAFRLRISPYSVRMRENVDQNNSKYGHFLRSTYAG